MDRYRKAAVLTDLADRMAAAGSWCGETHLQKAVYFLQTLGAVPTDFEFVLYKHGPFSFDLGDELTALRADGLFELEVQRAPYGPKLKTTARSKALRSRFPKTIATHSEWMQKVAEFVDSRGVAQLERLATALYVTVEEGKDLSVKDRARIVHAYKPHIDPDRCRQAVEEIDLFRAEFGAGKSA